MPSILFYSVCLAHPFIRSKSQWREREGGWVGLPRIKGPTRYKEKSRRWTIFFTTNSMYSCLYYSTLWRRGNHGNARQLWPLSLHDEGNVTRNLRSRGVAREMWEKDNTAQNVVIFSLFVSLYHRMLCELCLSGLVKMQRVTSSHSCL